MFKDAAECVSAAAAALRREGQSGGLSPDDWSLVRRHCKNVMVWLEARHQNVLAARIEREYEAFKRAWHEAAGSSKWAFEAADSAEELAATLSALDRFRPHIIRDDSHKPTTPDADAEQHVARRRRGRGYQTELRLQRFLAEHRSDYERLVPQCLGGDAAALAEFREMFGPRAIADRWAAEDNHRPDRNEANRWNSAIKTSSTYRELIQPLLGRPPRPPANWQDPDDGTDRWRELLS